MHKQNPRIGIVVTSNGIGGAEKRFARLFNYLSAHSTRYTYTLLLPKKLKQLLCEQKILTDHQKQVVEIFDSFPGNLFNHYHRFKFFKYRLPGRLLLPILRRAWDAPQVQQVLAGFDLVHFCSAHPLQRIPHAKPVVLEEPDSASQASVSPLVFPWLAQGAFLSCLSPAIGAAYLQVAQDQAMRDRVRIAPCSFIDYASPYVAPKERLIVFLGRMETIKHPQIFIAAIELLAQQRQDFQAVMLGTGWLDHELDALIVRRGLTQRLQRFYHPDPYAFLSRAAIFVSIQQFDNYPSQALIEAMACGCMPIASAVGQTALLVSPDVGYCVPLTAQDLAAQLDHALQQFAQTVAMGEAARAKVLHEHTVQRYACYLEELYQDVFSAASA